MTRDQLKQFENDLWASAENLRANSKLKASQYSTPVLGLIFLKFADINYRRHEKAIQTEFERLKGSRLEKPLHEIAVAKCGFYLPKHARYDRLLDEAIEQGRAFCVDKDIDINKALKSDDVFNKVSLFEAWANTLLHKDK